MNRNFFLRHWYADIYEQQVIQANEVNFILNIVGKQPLNILEIACGGGRISVPLAELGHKVTGFDFDEFMLNRALIKGQGFNNLSFYKADAVNNDWGTDFDAVILAGNILLNIESDMDYKQSQELFIQKAANCVKQGGYMYLDFDCFFRTDEIMPEQKQERICFEGTDDLGTYGKYIIISGEYSSKTCISKSFRRYEIALENGEQYSKELTIVKHFPIFEQVKCWLENTGWEIECLYGGYEKQSFNETACGNRAIIWAKKV